MWEVVGFRVRPKNDKVYIDIFLQRECRNGEGLEVKAGNYDQGTCGYMPRIGDKVVVEMGNYQGREYIRDIEVVS